MDNIEDDMEEEFYKVHLRVFKRNNKKCVTTIEGLRYEIVGPSKKFIPKFKRELACNGSIKEGVITFQGDQRQKIKQILIREKMADEKHIVIHGF